MTLTKFERIITAARNSKPSEKQLAEWSKRDAENEKLNAYDWLHKDTNRSALTGWTGRTLRDADSVQYSHAYAIEQGYDDPKNGVLFANWNDISQRVQSILERAGYSLEWEDEWTTCSSCGKALRASADSYSWQPAYADYSDCGEILCLECVDPSDYCDHLANNPRKALNNPSIDPKDAGYTLLPQTYENGFYEGMNDDPEPIYKALQDTGKYSNILFEIHEQSQFYIGFRVWVKLNENETR